MTGHTESSMPRRPWLQRWDESNQEWAARGGGPRPGLKSWPVTVFLAVVGGVVVLGGRWRTPESMTVSVIATAVTVILILGTRLIVGLHRRRR